MATSLTSAFTPETIRQHGLTGDEYEKIKQLLGGREPTLTDHLDSYLSSQHRDDLGGIERALSFKRGG